MKTNMIQNLQAGGAKQKPDIPMAMENGLDFRIISLKLQGRALGWILEGFLGWIWTSTFVKKSLINKENARNKDNVRN